MSSEPIDRRSGSRRTALPWLALVAATLGASAAGAQDSTARASDPRVGLGSGWQDAKSAIRNLQLDAHVARPAAFNNPQNPGDFAFANADLAFRGNLVFQGGYNGFQVWDVSDPTAPKLRASLACPGGQGDVSVLGNLLFVSVEETRGRVNCGGAPITDSVSAERFRGVRIFDITNLDQPQQVAAVQTCRGSHTHTLVTDPKDRANVYVYVSGTAPVRPGAELAGCSGKSPEEDPNTSLFRIEVIRVPLARPQDAKIVSTPRIFADTAGHIAGLWKGGSHGEGTQETSQTNQCHDLTVYPSLGLAAGACSGNGILLDIKDVANPKRVAEVSDPNFAYWHSATFTNDGKKLLFTDEWGGGVGPRCRATDRPEWGADAIFTLEGRKLSMAGYYKLPAPQSATENCVAHNGSLIPVPGRDIMVQAWYQGGVSVFDFTDPKSPKEIAFFDRGPLSDSAVVIGGYWSAYWYNGHIYGSEIVRGFDVFSLVPSDQLSRNEIEAAKLVKMASFNPQLQTKITWPASFVVARAYLDQLARNDGLSSERRAAIAGALDRAERLTSRTQRRAALNRLHAQLHAEAAKSGDPARVNALATAVHDLAHAGR